jgi:hypothetical protein
VTNERDKGLYKFYLPLIADFWGRMLVRRLRPKSNSVKPCEALDAAHEEIQLPILYPARCCACLVHILRMPNEYYGVFLDGSLAHRENR